MTLMRPSDEQTRLDGAVAMLKFTRVLGTAACQGKRGFMVSRSEDGER
jgi:hypothetical protein